MKLTQLKIRNLRGLQNIEFTSHGFSTIIGKNNCGKSSVLRAIELICTGKKPDAEEFFQRNTNTIEIEAKFEDLKEWERNNNSISSMI
jgi:Predicted ATPase